MTPPRTTAADVLAAHDAVSDSARPDAVTRQHQRGRHTARERIARLSGGRFYEFGALALPADLPAGRAPRAAVADGVVTGIAYVDGRPVAVAAVDFTVLGGSNGAVGMAKIERCVHRARTDRIPLVLLSDGGGHRMQEGLDARSAAFGSTLLSQLADLSGAVPIVSVMMGPGFGVGTNLAALSDFVVMVRGISTLGMSSAPFVLAATGEQLTNEEIGGADVQAGHGVADLAADTEGEALDAVRAFLGFLPSSCDQSPPRTHGPHVPADLDLDSIVPDDGRRSYDVRDVIDGLCDGDSVLEIRELHAPNVVTALTRIDGRPVGVVANQSLHHGGALDSPACEKAAHFIAVCDAFGLPILTLIDLPGFLIGSTAESSQLARRSGRLAFELGQATVPRFSVVLRKAYGAAYVAMGGGRSNDADLAVAWPSAEICAMPVDGAVDIAYRANWANADNPLARRRELIADLRTRTGALRAAEGFGIDDVVIPSQTRDLLIEALGRVPDRHPTHATRRFRSISPI